MKKKIVGLLILLNAMLLASCAGQKASIQESDAAGSAKMVKPLPTVLSVDTLDNCTFAASFNASDVYLNNDGALLIQMTAYDYERFDPVDISELTEGNTLVIHGNEMVVKSIERYKGGYLEINGGFEEGGCYLVKNETGVYFEIEMNAVKIYRAIGEITFPVHQQEFTFQDNADSENPKKESYVDDFLMEVDRGSSFSQYATTVTVENGLITHITRAFVP